MKFAPPAWMTIKVTRTDSTSNKIKIKTAKLYSDIIGIVEQQIGTTFAIQTYVLTYLCGNPHFPLTALSTLNLHFPHSYELFWFLLTFYFHLAFCCSWIFLRFEQLYKLRLTEAVANRPRILTLSLSLNSYLLPLTLDFYLFTHTFCQAHFSPSTHLLAASR